MADNDLHTFHLEYYQNRIKSAFSSLLDDEDFIDVTLVCEGKFIKAHRVVLSVFSGYFRRLLKNSSGKHPVIIIPDVSYENMNALVQFIYRGYVNVCQRNLESFLKAAESFKISDIVQQVNGGDNLYLQNTFSDEFVGPSTNRIDTLRSENSQGSQQAEELQNRDSIQGTSALPIFITFSPSKSAIHTTSNHPQTPAPSNHALHSSVGLTESHNSVQATMRPSTSNAQEQESNNYNSISTRTNVNQITTSKIFASPFQISQQTSPFSDRKKYEDYILERRYSPSVSGLNLNDRFRKMCESLDVVDSSWLSIDEENDVLVSENIQKSQIVKEEENHDSSEVNSPTPFSSLENKLNDGTRKSDQLGSNVSELVETMNLGEPSHMSVPSPDPSSSYGVSKQMLLVSSGSTVQSSQSESLSNEEKNNKLSKISPRKFPCSVCDKILSARSSLLRHMRTQHNTNS